MAGPASPTPRPAIQTDAIANRVKTRQAPGSFNLAKVNKVEPCVPAIRRRPTETTRQFIERSMRENHGYTVPEHWLADLDAIPDGDTGEPQSGYLVGVDTPTAQERVLLRRLAEQFGDGPATSKP